MNGLWTSLTSKQQANLITTTSPCYKKLFKHVKSIDVVYQDDTQTQLTIIADLRVCPHVHTYFDNDKLKNPMKHYINRICYG